MAEAFLIPTQVDTMYTSTNLPRLSPTLLEEEEKKRGKHWDKGQSR